MHSSVEATWNAIADRELARGGVTEGTGFGRNPGLRIGGRIYAMRRGADLVVKLPKESVDRLVTDGLAQRFDAGKGRPMKEWALVPAAAADRWNELVEEAREFVASLR